MNAASGAFQLSGFLWCKPPGRARAGRGTASQTFKKQKFQYLVIFKDLLFKDHPDLRGEGTGGWEKSLLYELHIEKEENRPIEDPARTSWGLEMLDTILPSLQDLGRNVLPTLPLLSQEGKLLEVGALGLNLYLLEGWSGRPSSISLGGHVTLSTSW